MWACIKECLGVYLPYLGAFALIVLAGAIAAGIVGLVAGTGGTAALTGAAIVGVLKAAGIGTAAFAGAGFGCGLVGCLIGCAIR